MIYFKNFILILILNLSLHANDADDFSKTEKMTLTNIAIASGILTWGFTQWGYGEESYHLDDEGWFENTTSNGGSDKLGHFYTNYLLTRTMAPIYEGWGYSKKEAGLYGSLTSITLSGILIEIGDGFSEHGFSRQDFIADAFGAVSGYLWYVNPSLAKKVDFRVEYNPFLKSDNITDFTTDYERMKHLLAIKAEGFELFKDTPMEYLELHVGYYSRNFNHDTMPVEERERHLYVGVGVNLSKLFRPAVGKYSTLFNYVQMPYTYIEKGRVY